MRYFSSLLFLIILVSVSCSEEEEIIPPNIELLKVENGIAGDTTLAVSEHINFWVETEMGTNSITSFIILLNENIYLDSGMYSGGFRYHLQINKGLDAKENWQFIVRGRQSESCTTGVVISLDTNITFGPVTSIENIQLGAQENQNVGSFYSLKKDASHFQEEAYEWQESIDMIYYYGNDNNTLASPGANIEDGIFEGSTMPQNWETRNTTRYIKTVITANEFSSVSNDSLLIASYDETQGKRKAKYLAAGDVYSFKTEDNRVGLLKINEVEGEQSGTVHFDVKIQDVETQSK